MSEQDRQEFGYRTALGRYKQTRKYGIGMIILFWIIVMALLMYIFSNLLEQQFNPNRRPQSSAVSSENRVVLQKNRYGHYVASGRINNHAVNFIVDTGATSISVPWTVAERIPLDLGLPMIAETANGAIQVYDTRLDNVEIGNVSVSNVRANINPHMQGEQVLLGMSFLNQLELNFKDGEMSLIQQKN